MMVAPATARPLPAWPVVGLLGGLALWWVTGALILAPTVAAFIMLVLMIRRGARWLPGMGPWICLFLWVLAAGSSLLTSASVLGYGLRLADVFDAAVIGLYVASARESLPRRTVVGALAATWLTMVGLGLLGQFFPEQRLTTPLGLVLPNSMQSNELIRDLASPQFTETQQPYGLEKPMHRTAAPFAYANSWGQAYAMLTPVAVAWVCMLRSWKTRALWVLFLLLSSIPALATSNRGMLVALGVTAAAATVRMILMGRLQLALGIISGAAAAGLAFVASGGLASITERLTYSSSTGDRLELYERTLDRVIQKPWLGHGSPELDPVVGVAFGTQGMVWLLLFCFGIPSLIFFAWFVIGLLVRGWRVNDVPGIWIYCSFIGMLTLFPFYALSGVPMIVFVIMGVVLLRDADAPKPRGSKYTGTVLSPGPTPRAHPVPAGPVERGLGSAGSQGASLPTAAAPPAPATRAPAPSKAKTSTALVTFALILTGAVVAFAASLLVGNTAGQGAAGLFFQVIAFFNIALVATTLGSDTGLVRAVSAAVATGRADQVPGLLRTALVPVAVASSLVAGALVLSAPWLDSLAPGMGLERSIVVSALLVPPGAIMTSLCGALRGLGRIRTFSVLQNLVLPLLRLAGVAMALVAGVSLLRLSMAWALPVALVAVLAALLVWNGTRIARREQAPADAQTQPGGVGQVMGRAPNGPVTEDITTTRGFWAFSSVRGVSALVETALEWIDVIFVGLFLGPLAAGAYGAVNRCVRLGSMLDQTARLVTGPLLSAAVARGRMAEAQLLYAATTRILVAAAWPFFLLLAVFAPVFLGFFGEGFAEASGPMSLISVAMMLVVSAGGVQSVLLMAGRSRWQLINKSAALLCAVAGCLTLIPLWGMWGAVTAWAVSVLVDAGLATTQAWVRLGFVPPFAALLRAGASSVVCVGLVGLGLRLSLGATLPALLLTVVLGGGAYAAVVWLRPGWFGMQAQIDAVRARLRGRGKDRVTDMGSTPR
ncbi:hypothetical protein DWQ67_05975 [Galactobacter caseinivorans]|uniref:Uncharacterized protein n=1 Tax=Galactobacter caseinivorans TaxID=2676123 RepID=A0A496PJR1_9MICC|nr:polysaccharide biosynthesis C-terminal domain-containing protein [Galactobacter caseinivorans]RKW70660.1 hypothetical protein DWQ67_05975 [Galactobacter caseinivorans]